MAIMILHLHQRHCFHSLSLTNQKLHLVSQIYTEASKEIHQDQDSKTYSMLLATLTQVTNELLD